MTINFAFQKCQTVVKSTCPRQFLAVSSGRRTFCSTPEKVEITRTVAKADLQAYADLTGDTNPIHFAEDSSIVHGTLLLGFVSSILGTKCPGPGTKVIELSSKFVQPCPTEKPIKIEVKILDAHRKIKRANFVVKSAESGKVFTEGFAKLM